jgi:hypothetical protein
MFRRTCKIYESLKLKIQILELEKRAGLVRLSVIMYKLFCTFPLNVLLCGP